MRYVDTSVLLALFLNEAKTPDAWQWLKNLQGSPLYVSYWTFTEFSSALGVRARMRLLDEPGRLQVIEDFRKLALARLVCVDCIPEDFQQAAAIMRSMEVRAPRWGCPASSHYPAIWMDPVNTGYTTDRSGQKGWPECRNILTQKPIRSPFITKRVGDKDR